MKVGFNQEEAKGTPENLEPLRCFGGPLNHYQGSAIIADEIGYSMQWQHEQSHFLPSSMIPIKCIGKNNVYLVEILR